VKIATIVGARPQFIKAAALTRRIRGDFAGLIDEVLVHSGQHYDEEMSAVFFKELDIPQPSYNLGVGSASHASQTAMIMERSEKVLREIKPDAVVVYGDTNTTLAGALAAAKIHIPVAHIEAGLRSFNRSMPEEINRIVCDHVSTWLFPPTQTGLENLIHEGFSDKNKLPATPDSPWVVTVGDVMYDNALHYSSGKSSGTGLPGRFGLEGKDYVLCTLHRDHNTDDPGRLNAIFRCLDHISRDFMIPVLIPLHPRTRKMMNELLEKDLASTLAGNPMMIMAPPLSYLEMIVAEKGARLIITDSGGVQKEAYFFRKPCLVLRAETEWTELVEAGAAMLVDADQEKILQAFQQYYKRPPEHFTGLFGDGDASGAICRVLSSGKF
jgi:UDP-GlcNAc3NAcA epimerase